MAVHVVVPMPDQLVDELHSLVDSGSAESRSIVIVTAIRREVRRLQDQRDVAILAGDEGTDELDAMHTHVLMTLADRES